MSEANGDSIHCLVGHLRELQAQWRETDEDQCRGIFGENDEQKANGLRASRCSLREFRKAFDLWFAEGVKGMRFDAEHADARDIAMDAATWAKDFLENKPLTGSE